MRSYFDKSNLGVCCMHRQVCARPAHVDIYLRTHQCVVYFLKKTLVVVEFKGLFTLPELKDSFLEILLRKGDCFQYH